MAKKRIGKVQETSLINQIVESYSQFITRDELIIGLLEGKLEDSQLSFSAQNRLQNHPSNVQIAIDLMGMPMGQRKDIINTVKSELKI